MIRRDFMRRLALSAAGLWLAEDVAELLIEPRRKYWPGADLSTPGCVTFTAGEGWLANYCVMWNETTGELVYMGPISNETQGQAKAQDWRYGGSLVWRMQP